jgi:hypothetical protein
VEISEPLPLTMVSILGAHVPSLSVAGPIWSVTAGERVIEFELSSNGICPRSLKLVPAPLPA